MYSVCNIHKKFENLKKFLHSQIIYKLTFLCQKYIPDLDPLQRGRHIVGIKILHRTREYDSAPCLDTERQWGNADHG